eukprot:6179459-Pleurochrysis_carterae.AAC.1
MLVHTVTGTGQRMHRLLAQHQSVLKQLAHTAVTTILFASHDIMSRVPFPMTEVCTCIPFPVYIATVGGSECL